MKDCLTYLRRELGITLPDKYVALLRNYPARLETTRLELGRWQETISERALLKSPERVLELNREVRQPGVAWLADGSGWPNRYLVIGDDDCGNYFAMEAGAGSKAVYFYEQETGQFRLHAKNLRAFAARMIRETLQFNRRHGTKQMKKARRDKRKRGKGRARSAVDRMPAGAGTCANPKVLPFPFDLLLSRTLLPHNLARNRRPSSARQRREVRWQGGAWSRDTALAGDRGKG